MPPTPFQRPLLRAQRLLLLICSRSDNQSHSFSQSHSLSHSHSHSLSQSHSISHSHSHSLNQRHSRSHNHVQRSRLLRLRASRELAL